MSASKIPFNIDLLVIEDNELKNLKEVTSLEIFTPSTNNFNPEGLFSTDIFGKIGTEHRVRMFGYIDMKIEIFHPVIYKALTDLRELHADIMSQTKFAKWDPKEKVFEPSDALEGNTGMSFFLKHWKDIKYDKRTSIKRDFNIRLIEKHKNHALFSKLLVLPAGLRDYEIAESGKPEEGEVNVYYRKILNMANLVSKDLYKVNPEALDSVRINMQKALIDLYDYYRSLLEGKNKFINAKWASRKIFNSTRNVISTINNKAKNADDPTILKFNQTAVGLYQHIKAIMPLSVYQIRDTYLANIFKGPNSPIILTNMKTLKAEQVTIDAAHYDEWMSIEGLTNVLNRFSNRDIRHEPLIVDKHYLGLIYKGPDNTFKFLQDIDDVPDPSYKQYISPITFTELIYISVYKKAPEIPGYLTRYPITGYGGIYPSFTHLKTTEEYETREELDSNWNRTGSIAIEFPVRDSVFFDTLAPHQSHVGRLGADYDGDVCSWTAVITEDSIKEIRDKINSVDYYIGSTGKIQFSANIKTIEMTLAYMTR